MHRVKSIGDILYPCLTPLRNGSKKFDDEDNEPYDLLVIEIQNRNLIN